MLNTGLPAQGLWRRGRSRPLPRCSWSTCSGGTHRVPVGSDRIGAPEQARMSRGELGEDTAQQRVVRRLRQRWQHGSDRTPGFGGVVIGTLGHGAYETVRGQGLTPPPATIPPTHRRTQTGIPPNRTPLLRSRRALRTCHPTSRSSTLPTPEHCPRCSSHVSTLWKRAHRSTPTCATRWSSSTSPWFVTLSAAWGAKRVVRRRRTGRHHRAPLGDLGVGQVVVEGQTQHLSLGVHFDPVAGPYLVEGRELAEGAGVAVHVPDEHSRSVGASAGTGVTRPTQ